MTTLADAARSAYKGVFNTENSATFYAVGTLGGIVGSLLNANTISQVDMATKAALGNANSLALKTFSLMSTHIGLTKIVSAVHKRLESKTNVENSPQTKFNSCCFKTTTAIAETALLTFFIFQTMGNSEELSNRMWDSREVKNSADATNIDFALFYAYACYKLCITSLNISCVLNQVQRCVKVKQLWNDTLAAFNQDKSK